MGDRGIHFIMMLSLLWAVGMVVADEPVNISMFNPETFQIPVPSGMDHGNLTLISLNDMESERIRGTGDLSKTIRVTDASGDQSVSELIINGSDETSWSYFASMVNTSSYSYTIIDLTVADADRVWAHSISTANENRDIAQSEAYVYEDVTGELYFGSAFPTDEGYSWMKGPESIMIMMDLSGSIDAWDVAEHYTGNSGPSSLNTRDMAQILSARGDEMAAMIDSDPEDLNRTEIRGSGLTLLQTDDPVNVSVGYISLDDSGTIEYREGFCSASTEEVRSGQYISNLTAPRLDIESDQVRDSGDDEIYGEAILTGRNVTAFTYEGWNYDPGGKARMEINYLLSADDRAVFSEAGYIGETMISDDIGLMAPVDDSSDTSTMLSGEHTLVFDDVSSSLTGTYDGSAPWIRHIGSGMGKTSQGGIYCRVGDPETTSMAALKGYVQTQGSSISAGSGSTQNLFYVDADRGVPMEWDSWAANDDDDDGVTSTGSSNAGSRFIRQKAYADRSTLIAS